MADSQTPPHTESAAPDPTQAGEPIAPKQGLGRKGMSLLIALGLACFWVMLMARPAQ